MNFRTENKSDRILTMFKLLMDGGVVNKTEMAVQFGVNARSVQRDIEDLRAYFAENRDVLKGNYTIIYDHKKKGFRLEGSSMKMSGAELLAVCKVLLESRAFTKEELEPILNKLIFNCAPPADRKPATDLIANERYHYIEPHHHSLVIDKLWELGNAVKNQQYVQMCYGKLNEDYPVDRLVKPVGIMFSEFYFYLIAFIEKKEDDFPEYLSPAIYRVDRICSYRILDRHFSVPYRERFEEGEFRKRVQFMYGGRLQRITFEYSGNSIEAVLDRLPTSVILEQRVSEDGKAKIYVVRAEVFGDGIDMWIRSQGEKLRMIEKKII